MATKRKNTRPSKAEMRVAIAKDVLAQLKAEKYVAEVGQYISSDLVEHLREITSSGNEQAQAFLKANDVVQCAVCAKGALFLSAVRKYNKATIADVECENMEVAESIFGKKQFDLIEAAFEQWDITKETVTEDGNCIGGVPCAAAYRFGMGYDDDTERLVAILKNIIKNNGIFKPS